MPQELQAHTFDIKHTITQWEARDIAQKYGVQNNQSFEISNTGIKGVNKMEVKRNPICKDGIVINYTYELCMQVNMGKLLNLSLVRMTELSTNNVRKMLAALSRIFAFKLNLNHKNSIAEDWTLIRFDSGIDIEIYCAVNHQTDSTYIIGCYVRLLHHALNLCNNRCSILHPYKGSESPNANRESLYFGNASYTFNVYGKLGQLMKTYTELTLEQYAEAEHILRIEKQIFGKGIANCIGSPQKLSLLLDKNIIQKIKKSIISDVKTYFGTGDYVSYEKVTQLIGKSDYDDAYKVELRKMFSRASKYGFQRYLEDTLARAKIEGADVEKVKEMILGYRRDLEKLGISVSGILKEEVENLGMDSLQGIYELINILAVPIPRKRLKGKFGRIYQDRINNRYRCNFSVHKADGKRVRVPMADRDKNLLEQKILDRLCEVHTQNLKAVQGDPIREVAIIEQTKTDIQNFRTIIEKPEILEAIDDVLRKL